MQEIFKDILTVAGKLKRLNEKRYPEFIGSDAFNSAFLTLLDLIEKWKRFNENSNREQ